MNRPIAFLFTLSGLLAIAGCGRPTTNEPKQLDKLISDAPAEPLPTGKASRHASTSLVGSPVNPTAFDEAADANTTEPATMPTVKLSKAQEDLCRVKVGDKLPEMELPKVPGGDAKLSSLYGKAATVVVFWKGDRQMALDELADLGPDVVEKFGSRGVEVVGVAVKEPTSDAKSVIEKTAASFPQLVDADGKAFAKVGSERFPWTLVLDADGKIIYFDLEYSLATRRELQQALLATVR